MYPKINVYINGIYQFSTTHYPTIKALKEHIRAVKHLIIASAPYPKYLTVYDYDKVKAFYAK